MASSAGSISPSRAEESLITHIDDSQPGPENANHNSSHRVRTACNRRQNPPIPANAEVINVDEEPDRDLVYVKTEPRIKQEQDSNDWWILNNSLDDPIPIDDDDDPVPGPTTGSATSTEHRTNPDPQPDPEPMMDLDSSEEVQPSGVTKVDATKVEMTDAETTADPMVLDHGPHTEYAPSASPPHASESDNVFGVPTNVQHGPNQRDAASGSSVASSPDLGASILRPRQPRRPLRLVNPGLREDIRQAQQRLAAMNRAAPARQRGARAGACGSSNITRPLKPEKQKTDTAVAGDDDEELGVNHSDAEARREYKARKKELKRKGELTFEEEIQLQRLKREEFTRRRMRREDEMRSMESSDIEVEDDSLFVPFQGTDCTEHPKRGKTSVTLSKKYGALSEVTLTSKATKRKASSPIPGASSTKKPSGRGKGMPSKAPINEETSSKAKTKAPKKRGRFPAQQLSNMGSLLTADLFHDADGNRERRGQPAFLSTQKKQDALRSLIASLPEAEQKAARSDRKLLDDATKAFAGGGNSVKPAEGEAAWKLSGLKSHLRHYQMIGASFMRERERGGEEPLGGLSADQMGLGKTLMMLANIVNDRPGFVGQRLERKTTLIVATPALAQQWFDEIQKHCEPKYIGKVLMHFGRNKLETNDTANALLDFSVV
jgi:SNF2-related domain